MDLSIKQLIVHYNKPKQILASCINKLNKITIFKNKLMQIFKPHISKIKDL